MPGSSRRSVLLSAFLHGVAILLIVIATSVRQSQFAPLVKSRDSIIYLPRLHLAPGAGGGGGFHSDRQASKGHPPKPAPRMMTPLLAIQNPHPQLAIEPAIMVPLNTPAPNYQLPELGSPTGVAGPASNGTGIHGGIGEGDGPRIGNGRGPDADGGPGGNGTPQRDPKRFRPPAVIQQHEPEYSDEARKAKLQGSVVLSIVVSATGSVGSVRVMSTLGLGLDEKAIEAVKQWSFHPATLDGRPVAATATVEVTFRLL